MAKDLEDRLNQAYKKADKDEKNKKKPAPGTKKPVVPKKK